MADIVSRAEVSFEGFLTPEAMLTPGIAGGLIMTITNVMAPTLSFSHAWLGLALSFLVGLLIMQSQLNLVSRLVFYVLNSLVIFTVAFGTNAAGVQAGMKSWSAVEEGLHGVSWQVLATPAMAAEVARGDDLEQQLDSLNRQYQEITDRIATALDRQDPSARALLQEQARIDQERQAVMSRLVSQQAAATNDRFFVPWKF